MTESDFEYNPETGVFRNKITGKEITGKQSKGYVTVHIRGKSQLAHRFAFFKMTGKWPDGPVDHVNRNRADNRWINLRITDSKGNRNNSEQSLPECRASRWEKQMKTWLNQPF